MTRPGLFTYLCGNPVSSLGSLGFLGWMVYQAYRGDMAYPAVFIVGLIAAHCWRCASQIKAYDRWQKDWDAMNGGGKGRDMFASVPWLRWPVAIALWLGVSFLAIGSLQGETRTIAVYWFWIVSLGAVVVAVIWLRMKRPKRAKPAKWEDVAACLNKSFVSANVQATMSALPGYCVGLLKRDNNSTT